MPPSNTAVRERVSSEEESAMRAAILDALGQAVVAADREGRVIYWNDAATSMFGWSAAEAMGEDLPGLVAADGSRTDALRILHHLRVGRGWAGDFFVKDRHGRSFPIHATTTAMQDQDGRVIGMVAVGRDLSAEHTAKEQLRQAEERLELVHRTASSVIWEWDVATGRLNWNGALADSFGYDPAEVHASVGWWEERLHPEDRGRVENGITNALAEGRRFWTEEYRFRRSDGTYATIFDRAYVAVDERGEPVRVVGTMLDLTERRRAHDAARFLSQTSMLLDLSLDYDGTLPNIARLATQTVADACLLLVGTPHGIEHVVAVAADPERQDAMNRATELLTGRGLCGTWIERVLRSGESVVLADFSPAFLRDASMGNDLRRAVLDVGLAGFVLVPMIARGKPVGAVLLGRTAGTPRTEDEDVRVAEELGRRIGVAVDNARLFQSAELARRAKSDFLSVVSHELRTPLTAVMGYAELLGAQLGGTLNEKQRHQVGRIRAGADKLLHVIEGILAYARLETGRERAQLENLQLAPLLDRIRDVIAAQAKECGVTFEEDLGGAPDRVCADSGKLTNVLLALLTNALKFSGEGGRCALRVAVEDRAIVFDVMDSGPGVSTEHLPHLFSPFWQAENPEVRRAGGSGLGLSVARRLTRLMGGELALLDTSPAGTTFRATLPLRDG